MLLHSSGYSSKQLTLQCSEADRRLTISLYMYYRLCFAASFNEYLLHSLATIRARKFNLAGIFKYLYKNDTQTVCRNSRELLFKFVMNMVMELYLLRHYYWRRPNAERFAKLSLLRLAKVRMRWHQHYKTIVHVPSQYHIWTAPASVNNKRSYKRRYII